MSYMKRLLLDICEAYDNGLETWEIAEQLNVSEEWVIDALVEWAPAMCRRPLVGWKE